jgi:hypothetical protein
VGQINGGRRHDGGCWTIGGDGGSLVQLDEEDLAGGGLSGAECAIWGRRTTAGRNYREEENRWSRC